MVTVPERRGCAGSVHRADRPRLRGQESGELQRAQVPLRVATNGEVAAKVEACGTLGAGERAGRCRGLCRGLRRNDRQRNRQRNRRSKPQTMQRDDGLSHTQQEDYDYERRFIAMISCRRAQRLPFATCHCAPRSSRTFAQSPRS